MTRVYFDCCCLQRPLDDQTQPRIKIESEVVIALLNAVQAGNILLLNSEALEYEIGRIPDNLRRDEVFAVLALSKEYIKLTDATEALAENLEKHGIRPMDAVHLALASTARADFFTTCDDEFLKKAQSITGLDCKVISIFNLIQEVNI
jgi:predicted nucleic acid-binding protein